ncbi:MAG: MiaB/RimO family radical SAM methylthiotransferase [Myxococcota bacterium]|nr:MiaB/RimO family radical SAM methylthiotransferase [Myxococcota bacterium]
MRVRPTIAIATLGCRSNQADSGYLAGALKSRGLNLAKGFDDADVVILNTCCVTAEAERDCRKLARRALATSASTRVIMIGCAVNAIKGFGQDIDARITPLHITPLSPNRTAEKILNYLGEGGGIPSDPVVSVQRRTRALVKVQNGCSHMCAYCIVPKARGPEVSRPMDDVIQEVDTLKASGCRELVLTGVQLGAWGTDLPHTPHLADLVVTVADRFAPGRIRLSSVEPWSVNKSLIEAVANHDRVCPHLHLPLQSGDDQILKAMGRGYTARTYLRLIEHIRAASPDIAIGTDVLFGFPGEDDAAFTHTMAVLAQIAPAYLHAFTYSARPGTPAEKLSNPPPKAAAKQRTRIAREFGEAAGRAYRLGQVGQVREVIVEARHDTDLTGLTDTFIPVIISTVEAAPGQLIQTHLHPPRQGEDRLKAYPV